MPADGRWDLTLILLTCRIWWAPNNVSKWQMRFNSTFKGLNKRRISVIRKHYSTSRKVAGSISDCVIRIFNWHNTAGRTKALGSTQPLTQMSTRNICLWVKAAGAYDWQTFHPYMKTDLKSGCLNLLEPSGLVQGCSGIALPSPFTQTVHMDIAIRSCIYRAFGKSLCT